MAILDKRSALFMESSMRSSMSFPVDAIEGVWSPCGIAIDNVFSKGRESSGVADVTLVLGSDRTEWKM